MHRVSGSASSPLHPSWQRRARVLATLSLTLLAWAAPSDAAGPRPSRSMGSPQFGPESTEIQGWGSKGAHAAASGVQLRDATAASLPALVTEILGYDPFVLSTTAGSMTLDRGTGFAAGAAQAAAGTGDPLVCIVVTSVPAQVPLADHLTENGCEIIRPLSVNSYAVRADLDTLQALASDPLVYWVGQAPSELKIDPALAAQLNMGGPRLTTEADGALEPDMAVIGLYDPADGATVTAAVAAAGGTVEHVHPGGDAIVCAGLDAAAVQTLAELAEVCYVSGYYRATLDLVTSVGLSGDQNVIGNDAITRYGSHISVGMIDSGYQVDHDAFRAHQTVPAVRPVGSSTTDDPVDILVDDLGHGTSVASVILSRWIPEPLLGVAPWTGGGPTSFFRYIRTIPPGGGFLENVDVAMTTLFNENTTLVINNSWGTPGLNPSNGTDDTSLLADNLTWQRRQIWVFSAGNTGTAAGTIESPAVAKNVIAVGSVSNTAALTLSGFSSEGPSDDMRKKPDIYAPGDGITVVDAADPKGTLVNSGTSFSAPHVTGFLATLLDHFPDVQRRPQLAKAMMMAVATPNGTLQPHTGVLNSFETHFATSSSALFYAFTPGDVGPATTDTVWDLNGIPAGLSGLYCVLTWIEPPAALGALRSVLNDIDLFVDVGKEGFIDFQADSSFDNVETIFIPTPPAGDYRFLAHRFSATTNYAPALAVYGFVPGAARDPITPRLVWNTPPPPSTLGRAPINLSWTLANFAGAISQHQVHTGTNVLLQSSPLQPNTAGAHALTVTAPNVGTFDSPALYRYVVGALDGGTQVLSRFTAIEVAAGPLAPVVEWIVLPPATATGGSSFMVQWRVRNFVDPVAENAAAWGITGILGKTADQPGANNIYTATVNVPVVGQSGTLLYTAFASNPIEFAFAPLISVLITP